MGRSLSLILSHQHQHMKKTITMITNTTLLFLVMLSYCSNAACGSSSSSPRPFKRVYAFGDSYTDTGNTHSNTGPSGFMFVSNLPYGSTFFHRPTNRYSDGRLVIDFVAAALSLPTFLPPYLTTHTSHSTSGLNFAVAGSTAIIHSFFVKNNMTLNITPQSIHTQLAWFNQYLQGGGCRNLTTTPAQCRAAFNDALIWVGEIGANDYAYSYLSSVSPKTVQTLAINSITAFLHAVLEKGAKYMVVQGLPPTGCLTLSLYLAPPDDRDSLGCVASANKQSYAHNAALKTEIDILRNKFPESTILYADYYNAYLDVMRNANRYGLNELFKVCCGYGGGSYNFNYMDACGSPSASACSQPSQYINWDGVHLTEAMYRAMANSFLNGTFSHPPFSLLLIKKQQQQLSPILG